MSAQPYRGVPPCEGCEGKGQILDWDGMGSWEMVTCRSCKGSGVACKTCHGRGRILASSDPDESDHVPCPTCVAASEDHGGGA